MCNIIRAYNHFSSIGRLCLRERHSSFVPAPALNVYDDTPKVLTKYPPYTMFCIPARNQSSLYSIEFASCLCVGEEGNHDGEFLDEVEERLYRASEDERQ